MSRSWSFSSVYSNQRLVTSRLYWTFTRICLNQITDTIDRFLSLNLSINWIVYIHILIDWINYANLRIHHHRWLEIGKPRVSSISSWWQHLIWIEILSRLLLLHNLFINFDNLSLLGLNSVTLLWLLLFLHQSHLRWTFNDILLLLLLLQKHLAAILCLLTNCWLDLTIGLVYDILNIVRHVGNLLSSSVYSIHKLLVAV